jgi:internalin A
LYGRGGLKVHLAMRVRDGVSGGIATSIGIALAHSPLDGLSIARECIAQEAEEKTGFLDLGKLGLTELPEELFRLKHLRRLNLGSGYDDAHGEWQESINSGERNSIGADVGRLAELSELRSLFLRGTGLSDVAGLADAANLVKIDCSYTQVSDLAPVAGLSNLQTLNFSNTQVNDLSPVSGLSNLKTLYCTGTQVSDLAPLSGLSNLKTLYCASTQVSDLAPLSGLFNLQTLNFYNTQVSDLAPVSGLSNLQWLRCSGTQVGELSPVSGLSNLQTLDCSSTQVSDLTPLAVLSNLQSLDCDSTQVSDLAPLGGLSNLQTLDCSSTRVSDLTPLAVLSNLQSLDCDSTQVSDLAPVSGLSNLQWLRCSGTQVSELSPVSGLSNLQWLRCSGTQVSELSPVSGLSNLETLDCSFTQVSNLTPLAGLSNLQSLDCYDTQVSDLAPLAGLSNLENLDCSGCRLAATPHSFWRKIRKMRLVLYQTIIPHVPAEVLSQEPHDDCFDPLRAHLEDAEAGSEEVSDVKLMVLGNGRIGKTQICRRLRDEQFDETVASTHGILVTSAPLTQAEDAAPLRLQIWDFGGQDIYHGTHALFLRSRAIFLLVWIPETENGDEYRHDGIAFRNQPLPYWVEYVRRFGGTGSPLLVLQTRCDRPQDELTVPPLPTEALSAFPFPPKLLRYSAKRDRGRASLDEALQQAAGWLKEQQGVAEIGIGRAHVKRRIEEMRDADAACPPEERQHRIITREHFRLLCDEAGGISDVDQFLLYLHNAGTVFYRSGLFGDRIVLDQGWALESIYAVLHREKCFRKLQRQKGRFTPSDLAEWLWDEQGHGVDEQKLFLSMMQSCGICFCVRPGRDKIEAEYVAPDFLPARAEIEPEMSQKWDDDAPTETEAFTYPMLFPGLMRGIISRIGSEAGLNADYWRGGIYVFESGTRSRAIIEQEMTDGWQGRIHIRTQRGQAALLLERLAKLVEEEQSRTGMEPLEVTAKPTMRIYLDENVMLSGTRLLFGDPEQVAAPPLKFVQEPTLAPEYFVSYAWGDDTPEGRERKAVVDRLCAEAASRGVTIIRDETALSTGDRISTFMARLARANRLFVILSDRYLMSPYCMFELFEVWRSCRGADEEFLRRIRVLALPSAKIWSPEDRALCAVYWRDKLKKLDALVKKHGIDILGENDAHQHRLMKKFANEIGDILWTVADTLRPRDFDTFLRHGFSDRPPDAP